MTVQNSVAPGSKAAKILGIISICTFFLAAVGIPQTLAVIALIMGFVKKEKSAIITGAIGLAVSILFVVIMLTLKAAAAAE